MRGVELNLCISVSALAATSVGTHQKRFILIIISNACGIKVSARTYFDFQHKITAVHILAKAPHKEAYHKGRSLSVVYQLSETRDDVS